MRFRYGVLFVLVWAQVSRAWAHPAHPSSVTVDWGLTSVELTAQLPVDQLAMARRLPPTRQLVLHGSERAALTSYLHEHIKASDQDGRPLAVEVRRLSTTEVDGLTHLQAQVQLQASSVLSALRLDYDAILHRVASHKILLFKGRDISDPRAAAAPTSGPGELQTTLRYQHTTAELDGGSQRVLRTGLAFLQLGAEHIAAGSDHLLFLLLLLLPAPFLAGRRAWTERRRLGATIRHVAVIATAFTLGHSLTLVLGALGLLQLPERFVEQCIAASLAVAACHALRPLAARGEALVAALFGLIHGLAFARILQGYGYHGVALLYPLVSFNLGIELFQLGLLLLVTPLWVWLSRTQVAGPMRVAGAIFGLIAAMAWLGERTFAWPNPVAPLVEVVFAGPMLGLFLLGTLATLAVHGCLRRRSGRLTHSRLRSRT